MAKHSYDLPRRRPVWQALSELFFDTELEDSDFRYIARVIAESGYDDAEVTKILGEEVFPVCAFSLISPAGVWPAFPLEWLEEKILRNADNQVSLQQVLAGYPWRLIGGDWKRVLRLLPEARHVSGNPRRPYPVLDNWPVTVLQLARSLQAGEDCRLVLADSLDEAGHPLLADHFRVEESHPEKCWALTLILAAKPP